MPIQKRTTKHSPWDGVTFEVLAPRAAQYGCESKPSALSCVLRVQGRHSSLLLAGDIEADQELALVAAYGKALASDWLLVPHHGSRTSSAPEFIAAVGVKDALIPVVTATDSGIPGRT